MNVIKRQNKKKKLQKMKLRKIIYDINENYVYSKIEGKVQSQIKNYIYIYKLWKEDVTSIIPTKNLKKFLQ